jgi:hypothetical protein
MQVRARPWPAGCNEMLSRGDHRRSHGPASPFLCTIAMHEIDVMDALGNPIYSVLLPPPSDGSP